jgi:acyl carrier protein
MTGAVPSSARSADADEVWARIEAIFHDIFDDDAIVLRPTMTAQDVDGWDSLANIRLIVAIEREFSLKFTSVEISHLENVGQLIALVQSKLR